jgi:hypothetical protein
MQEYYVGERVFVNGFVLLPGVRRVAGPGQAGPGRAAAPSDPVAASSSNVDGRARQLAGCVDAAVATSCFCSFDCDSSALRALSQSARNCVIPLSVRG